MRGSVLGIVGMVGLVSVLAGALGCSGNGGGGSGGNGSGGSAGSSGGQAAGGRGGNGSGGTVGGAGGSSGGQGGNGGSAIASCNAYCDAYIAAACPTPFYTSANECKSAECGDISKIASAACLATVTTFYDCERTQADICGDAGCTNEFTAVITACS